MAYLIIRFEKSLKRIDRLVKGYGTAMALYVALALTNGAGGCLDPGLGFAQSIYIFGYMHDTAPTTAYIYV